MIYTFNCRDMLGRKFSKKKSFYDRRFSNARIPHYDETDSIRHGSFSTFTPKCSLLVWPKIKRIYQIRIKTIVRLWNKPWIYVMYITHFPCWGDWKICLYKTNGFSTTWNVSNKDFLLLAIDSYCDHILSVKKLPKVTLIDIIINNKTRKKLKYNILMNNYLDDKCCEIYIYDNLYLSNNERLQVYIIQELFNKLS